MNPSIHGLWPALLHPVADDGTLDTVRAIAHARNMLDAGCDGVTLFGTTGEGPAFTVAERNALLDAMLQAGIPAERIVVTTTAVALGDVVALGRHALQRGVVRQMWMPPFYFNQPGDAGVVKAAAQMIDGLADARLRVLLYHFPAMSTYGFSHAAIAELVRRFPEQVVGLKDSSGDLAHAQALVQAFPQLSILVGFEPHVAAVMQAGGAGSINGLANVAPRLMRRVVDAPHAVSAQDSQCMQAILALMQVRPNLPFLGVYKTILAEQSGDATWMHMRAPLSDLAGDDAQAVRQGYRSIGPLLGNI